MKNKSQSPLSPHFLAQFEGGQGVFRWTDTNEENYIGKVSRIENQASSSIRITLVWLVPFRKAKDVHGKGESDTWQPTREADLNYSLTFENVCYGVQKSKVSFKNRNPKIKETFSVSKQGKNIEDTSVFEIIHEKSLELGFLASPKAKA